MGPAARNSPGFLQRLESVSVKAKGIPIKCLLSRHVTFLPSVTSLPRRDAMLATDDATSSHPTHSASAELTCGTHQLAARQDVLQAIITANLVFAENLVSIPEIAHACPPNLILQRGGVVNLLFRAARMHKTKATVCAAEPMHPPPISEAC